LTLFVQSLQDPFPEPLLKFEEELDAGEIDPKVLRQVAYPEDPPQVVLREEADVRFGAGGADQTLVFVDAQGAGVNRDDVGCHADHVDRPCWIDPCTPTLQHPDRLQPYQYHCQESYPQNGSHGGKGALAWGVMCGGRWGGSYLLEVAAVRNVEDHRVASAEQRLAKALPVAVVQDAIPPVTAGVLRN